MLGFAPLASTPLAALLVGAVAVSGVVGTAVVGTVTVTAGGVINAGSSVGTTELGTVTVNVGTGVTVNITGFEATATLNGAVIVTGSSLVVAASFPTVISLGTVVQRTTANIAVSSPLMNGIVGVGTSVFGDAIVTLTGVQASGKVGNVILWGNIVPSVEQIWTPIAA